MISLTSSQGKLTQKIQLKNVMQKFDPDMLLFLMLFQRQADKAKLDESELVTNLFRLLPVDIENIILREPLDLTDN